MKKFIVAIIAALSLALARRGSTLVCCVNPMRALVITTDAAQESMFLWWK